MGIFDRLLGRGEPKPGSAQAKKRAHDMLVKMQGIQQRAKYSGGYPVCAKCGFRFPMTKKQIDEEGGINITICPQCQTSMEL